jgi:hypothetical protein
VNRPLLFPEKDPIQKERYPRESNCDQFSDSSGIVAYSDNRNRPAESQGLERMVEKRRREDA